MYGGRLEAYAQVLLLELSRKAVMHEGKYNRPLRLDVLREMARGGGTTQVSLSIKRWQRIISTWLHFTLSNQLRRLHRPDYAVDN